MGAFRYLLLAGLFVVSSAYAQTSPEVKAVDSSSKPLAVGARWSYQNRDELTNEIKGTYSYVVTEVTDKDIGVRLEILGKPGFSYLTYDHSWNLVGDSQWDFLPNDGTGVQSPLTVGKEWAFDCSQTLRSRGFSLRSNGNSKVVGRENITTEAGTFDAFKIETKYALRDANDPTKTYDVKLTTWYAPAIDHWVKREQKIRFEGNLRESTLSELLEYDSPQ
ncbi:MAG: hypothetical protein AB1508_02940 [Pseudomonadota bacterium]